MQICFSSGDRFLSFCIADDGDVIKCIVALSAHAIEQSKGTHWTSGQILLRELNDCDVVAELLAWPLSEAEHECQRAFNHGLIGNLVGRLGIDDEVFASGSAPLLCVGEKLFSPASGQLAVASFCSLAD
jgi:hypothetical protein